MKKKWSCKDISILEKHVISNAEKLISNFYKNIIVGYIRFPKPYGFFTNLSKLVNKSVTQCKSKINEMEKELYLELLSISFIDYCLFLNIRQQKLGKNNKANKFKSKDEPDILSKKNESGSLIKNSEGSQKFSPKKLSRQSLIKKRVFLQMYEEDIKQKRHKIMQRFLKNELKIHFKNKG